MERKVNFISIVFIVLFTLTGCAKSREMWRGFTGVSTRILEDKRGEAIKKSFALDYNHSYLKVKEVLGSKGNEAYIYAEVPREKLIAVYLSETDTTPVGIFFTEAPAGTTLVEISSPSIYAKEEISRRVFSGLNELLKPAPQEKKSDVKEKPAN